MKSNIFYVLKKELRDVFRDKKSLMMMLLMPFLLPVIVISFSALFDMEVNKSVEEYNNIGFNYTLTDNEKQLAKSLKIKVKSDDVAKLEELYDEKKIDAYIIRNGNKYTIRYDQNNQDSSVAGSLADEYLTQYKIMLQNDYLVDKGISSNDFLNIITVDYDFIEKKEDNYFANYITSYSFVFIIMIVTISAIYPATDATAGEKERGTLETLLTFPIKSRDIIIGKFLCICLTSIITGILSLVLSLIALNYVDGMFEIYKGINIVPNTPTILITGLIIICFAILISGICIAVASLCKTFKEAQSSLSPINFITFFPGLVALFIEIKTTPLISIIPFLNYTQIFNDVNAGNINYLNIFLMFISTIIYIMIVIYCIVRQYKSEKVLFSN